MPLTSGVQVIKDFAGDIDQLTPQVVEAAMRVKKEPGNRAAKEQLDSSRRYRNHKISCFFQIFLGVGILLNTQYSGTAPLWTPWGPGKLSCTERYPHFRGKCIIRIHIWDIL